MSDDQAPTVRSRALTAGIPEDRLSTHFDNAALLLDGEQVSDLAQPAPLGTRITIRGA
ncbi:hypothetical protein [Pseudonocardia sp. HH130630-07]|uniref:hypothetical protein n=1 Tax=Pseudonocardia sp. HH130630-07 TaxID=1690815 RepID=UPI0012EA5D60|nr:hypothetical protein [Pseudonocardia sp. HH130630-07]